jgi:antitoxin component of MazEF toxin-antitoxin module
MADSALPFTKAAIKQGNGYAVRIPHELVRHFKIRKGDLLVVMIEPVKGIDARAGAYDDEGES